MANKDQEQETRFFKALEENGRAAVKWGDRYASAEFNDDHDFYEINVYDQDCRFLGDHYLTLYKGANSSPVLTSPKDVLEAMRGPMGRVEHQGVPLETIDFDALQVKLQEAGPKAGMGMDRPARAGAAEEAARAKETFLAKCRADARAAAYSDAAEKPLWARPGMTPGKMLKEGGSHTTYRIGDRIVDVLAVRDRVLASYTYGVYDQDYRLTAHDTISFPPDKDNPFAVPGKIREALGPQYADATEQLIDRWNDFYPARQAAMAKMAEKGEAQGQATDAATVSADQEQKTRFFKALEETGAAVLKWGNRYASVEYNDDEGIYIICAYGEDLRCQGDHYLNEYDEITNPFSPRRNTTEDVWDAMQEAMTAKPGHKGDSLEFISDKEFHAKIEEMEKGANALAAKIIDAIAPQKAPEPALVDAAMAKILPGKKGDAKGKERGQGKAKGQSLGR